MKRSWAALLALMLIASNSGCWYYHRMACRGGGCGMPYRGDWYEGAPRCDDGCGSCDYGAYYGPRRRPGMYMMAPWWDEFAGPGCESCGDAEGGCASCAGGGHAHGPMHGQGPAQGHGDWHDGEVIYDGPVDGRPQHGAPQNQPTPAKPRPQAQPQPPTPPKPEPAPMPGSQTRTSRPSRNLAYR